jgi:hypothetical protein
LLHVGAAQTFVNQLSMGLIMEEVVDDDPAATSGMREDALKQVEAAAFPRMFVRVLVHWAESLSKEYQQRRRVGSVLIVH